MTKLGQCVRQLGHTTLVFFIIERLKTQNCYPFLATQPPPRFFFVYNPPYRISAYSCASLKCLEIDKQTGQIDRQVDRIFLQIYQNTQKYTQKSYLLFLNFFKKMLSKSKTLAQNLLYFYEQNIVRTQKTNEIMLHSSELQYVRNIKYSLAVHQANQVRGLIKKNIWLLYR